MGDYESRRDDARQAAAEDALETDCWQCGHPQALSLCDECDRTACTERARLTAALVELDGLAHCVLDTTWSAAGTGARIGDARRELRESLHAVARLSGVTL